MTSHESDLPPPTEGAEPPLSIARLLQTLRAYRSAILLALAAAALIYLVLALAWLFIAPADHSTRQHFRLEFKGAESGLYPNGTKFGSGDITSTPVLLAVFEQNKLGRYVDFATFNRSLFVLQSNPDYARLAAEYARQLADPRLTPVDRDRIQTQFEQKKAALSKNDYALTWLRSNNENVPETVAVKTVVDVLNTWARQVANEQRVLEYRLAVMSPDMVNVTPLDSSDLIVSLQILRAKVNTVIQTIEELQQVPGAEMLRTPGKERLSLMEVRLRLEEILRFRLDPLVGQARASGLVKNPAATIQILESQLEFDERRLQQNLSRAASIKQALSLYTAEAQQDGTDEQRSGTGAEAGTASRPRSNDGQPAAATQLTDAFIDRLVTLTTNSADIGFRQRLISDYLKAEAAALPVQQAVAYDRAVIERLKQPASASFNDAAVVQRQITETREEVRQLIVRINELHGAITRLINPSSQMMTISAAPVHNKERGINYLRMVLGLPLMLLILLPIACVAALIHNRVREEQALERAADRTTAAF